MGKFIFMMAVHNHQPVGNFDSNFEEAFNSAYLPFIEVLSQHPKIKVSIHYTGSLLDWLQAQRPEFLDRLKDLITKGQVELLTGGYYEPLLPLIPDRDKLGQIELLSKKIEELFSFKPRGIWLAERVWEPQLPKFFNQAKIEYTVVDDIHFKKAGLNPQKIWGFYVTEEEGGAIFIFPGSERLRYLMPFKLPKDTINYLREFVSWGNQAIVLADDGEKFGLWPGTHKWVYKERWLENFFSCLEENSDWIEVTTLSEFLDNHGPGGRIYLPCASYREMMEWSGGFFRNFLVKYPEANNMHKKMLLVSEKVDNSKLQTSNSKLITQAKGELYKGQCNCAYWHGVFGGLYLNHLRQSVYSHLLEAEKILDKLAHKGPWIESACFDFNKDGRDEILINSTLLNLYLSPFNGGCIFEMDYKPKSINLTNTITRRKEDYHQKIKHMPEHSLKRIKTKLNRLTKEIGRQPLSIHEIVGVKEKGLEAYLIYDRYQKVSLLDFFFDEGTSLEDFSRCQFNQLGNFINQPYEYKIREAQGKIELNLSRCSSLQFGEKEYLVSVVKSVEVSRDTPHIHIRYELKNLSKERLSVWFGVEFNLSVEDTNLGCIGQLEKIEALNVDDTWHNVKVRYELDKKTDLWHFPIETISESEEGMERTYQGLTLLFRWRIEFDSKDVWQVNISQYIKEHQ